jgi:hypothetical protein
MQQNLDYDTVSVKRSFNYFLWKFRAPKAAEEHRATTLFLSLLLYLFWLGLWAYIIFRGVRLYPFDAEMTVDETNGVLELSTFAFFMVMGTSVVIYIAEDIGADELLYISLLSLFPALMSNFIFI